MRDDKVIFTFESNGEKLIFDGTDYGILNYDGLESTEYDLEVQNNINDCGGTMKKKRILPRPISIEFEYRGKDKSGTRQKLIRFFSPYRFGILTVGFLGVERKIEYEVSGTFGFKNKNIHYPLTGLLELVCMDPMFYDTIQTGERISTWINGWRWPFTLPFKLKQRGESKKNIINSGDVETPVEIQFHGPAVNPKITNLTTGEFIRVKRELTTDDTLYINTAFGKKKVEIIRNGVSEDAFDYIDLASSFFSLQVGDNVIEYSTENDLDPQSVAIYYYNRYIGV